MIQSKQEDGVWTITLNRPEKANALNQEMLGQLCQSVREASAQKAKVLLLTGAGKVFSAGADLEAVKHGLATDPVWQELSGAIAAFEGLSCAALNGAAAGGALGMVLACDVRIAVPEAKFFYPVMKLGFLPQPGDPVRLAALVGPARAKMMLMMGCKITARQAQLWGLVDMIAEGPGSVLQLADEHLGDLRGADHAHIAAIKERIMRPLG